MIKNIHVTGEVSGSGRLGFLGVDVHAATLSMDPDVKVTFKLKDPGTIAADNKIKRRIQSTSKSSEK